MQKAVLEKSLSSEVIYKWMKEKTAHREDLS
jgi:hypothetical protein